MSSLSQRILSLIEQEYGAAAGALEHELHAAVAKLVGRAGELHALRELNHYSAQAFERVGREPLRRAS